MAPFRIQHSSNYMNIIYGNVLGSHYDIIIYGKLHINKLIVKNMS